jgi:2-keto-myo-inositol isomerase
MKIGFNQATTMKYSTLEKDLAACEKYGYDFIEIRFDKLKDYLKKNSIEDLAGYFQHSRIKPCTFNALEFITFRNEEDDARMKADLEFLCKTGNQIGCDTIIVVPTFDIKNTRKEIIQHTAAVLNDYADTAAKYGMRLAFEFVGYPNCSVNTLDLTNEVIAKANRKEVGFVFDCFHFHAMNSTWDALNNVDISKLFILHMDDSEDLVPGILRDDNRLWPGEGCIDLSRILQTLKNKGYDDIASLELFRPEYWEMDIDQVISLGYEKTKGLLKKFDLV